ncbi:MAG: radical SAM/SPASM domain-containing protein [Candidatus Dojkabacteria bacterium]
MIKRLKFHQKALLSGLKDTKPYKLNFAVTYRCNHRCLNCNIWQKKIVDELTTDEIKKFFQKYQFSWINLTGGEIVLRPDIEDILDIVNKYNKDLYVLSLTSNALSYTRLIKITEKISRMNVPYTMATISLDGVSEMHNKVRGLPNAFKHTMLAIEGIKDIPGIQFQIGYTIYQENVGKLKGFVRHMEKNYEWFDVNKMHVNTMNLSGHYYSNKGLKIAEDYNEKARTDIRYFMSRFKKDMSYAGVAERAYQKLNAKFQKTGVTPLPCKALSASVFLDPNGFIYPCIIWTNKLGNLRNFDYDLNKIYETDEYKGLRELIKQKKCPNCWTSCEATQTMLGNLMNPHFFMNIF